MTLSDRSGFSTSSLQSRESNTCIQSCIIRNCTVLWNRNDLLPFRLRLWKSLGSSSGSGSGSGSGSDHGSGSRQYFLHSFSTTKKWVQNLAFSVSETAIFPRKLAYKFCFLNFFIHYMLDICWIRIQTGSGTVSGIGTGTGSGTVMHSGSGSA